MLTIERNSMIKLIAPAVLALLLFCAISIHPGDAAPASGSDTVDMKLLLICADGNEPSCLTATDILSRLGTPYTMIKAASQPLTADMVSDGLSHAYYDGVILSTGNLTYVDTTTSSYQSAFTSGEWQILHDFESRYGLREASLYTFPTADYGLSFVRSVDTSQTPLNTSLTPAGKEIFSYLNTSSNVTFKNAWGYLSGPTYLSVPTGSETTPLIQTPDGLTVAATHHYDDGRIALALCIDNNPDLTHSQELMYGVVRWVSRDLLLGERHVYLSPQIDDIFIGDDIWDPATNAILPEPNEFTIKGSDLDYINSWQQHLDASHPSSSPFRTAMVFNGEGVKLGDPTDTLTLRAQALQGNFFWVNHTYSHENLDSTNYNVSLAQIVDNNTVATNLGLTLYDKAALVTGDMSGLTNPNFLQAAKDAGVQFVASNTSIAGQGNPTPNTGIVNPIQPSILEVPRHPTNIFYNVSTPEQEVSEYNFLYRSYWGHDLTYQQIIDFESDQLLSDMLKYDIDPLMFHEGNLGVYNSATYGQGTLYSDLINAAMTKYDSLFSLPVISLNDADIGRKMKERADYNNGGVSGSLSGGSVKLSALAPCTAPVTGLSSPNEEIYGGEPISHINLQPGQTVNTPASGGLTVSGKMPAPDSTVNDSRPHIGLDYADPAWGINTAAVTIQVDGADVTSSSMIKGTYVTYVPQALAAGQHSVTVTAASNSGQTITSAWSFSSTSPNPSISMAGVFWASYADYIAGKLSVTYSLVNHGTGVARNGTVHGGIASSGVLMDSSVPTSLGDLQPGASTQFTLSYLIPPGVTRFQSITYLTVTDDGGNSYGMPGPA